MNEVAQNTSGAKPGMLISYHDFPLLLDDQSFEARQIRSNIDMWLVVARDAMADNTLVAYKQDWMTFCDWCESQSGVAGICISPLPAEVDTILEFIDYSIGRRAPASIGRCLSTISKLHEVANVKNPLSHVLVKTAKKKIGTGLKREKLHSYEKNQLLLQRFEQEKHLKPTQRTISQDQLPVVGKDICHNNLSGQQRQAAPLMREDLRQLQRVLSIDPLESTDGVTKKEAKTIRRRNAITLKRARDRALVHLAYDSMLRVSELVRVKVEDLHWDKDGSATLSIGQRKDSRHGEQAEAYITKESCSEITRWLSMAGISAGPLLCGFSKGGELLAPGGKLRKKGPNGDYIELQAPLTTRAVLDVYKTVTDLLGLDSEAFSCHSTRIGATHDMNENDIDLAAQMLAGRWKTPAMPIRYGRKHQARKGAMAQMEKRNDK